MKALPSLSSSILDPCSRESGSRSSPCLTTGALSSLALVSDGGLDAFLVDERLEIDAHVPVGDT